jgi:hypothetical protein
METLGNPIANLNTLDGWDSLLPEERNFLTTTNATITVAISAVKWLISRTASGTSIERTMST